MLRKKEKNQGGKKKKNTCSLHETTHRGPDIRKGRFKAGRGLTQGGTYNYEQGKTERKK